MDISLWEVVKLVGIWKIVNWIADWFVDMYWRLKIRRIRKRAMIWRHRADVDGFAMEWRGSEHNPCQAQPMNTREMTTEELLRMGDEEIDFSDIPESEADFFVRCLRRNMTPTCASRLGTRRYHKSEKAFQSWSNA